MSRTPGSSQGVIEMRRRRVQRYLLDGHGLEEVAELLGVHRATVFRDVRAIQWKNLTELRGVDAEVLAARIDQHWRLMMRYLAGLMEEHVDEPAVMAEMIRTRVYLEEKRAALFQTLGVVYRAPVEITWEQRLVRVVMSLTPEQKAEVDQMPPDEYRNWLQRQGLLPDRETAPRRLLPGEDVLTG